MILGFSPAEVLFIFGVMAVASFIQSCVGFGLALIAGPFLLMTDPGFVPGPMLAAALGLTLLIAGREFREIDLRGVGYVMLGRIPGTLVAVTLLAVFTQHVYDLVFAGIVLVAVALSASGWRFQPTPRAATLAGFTAGLMGTISSIGGPALALLYQHSTGPRMRSTLGAMFVLGALVSLTALTWIGRFGAEELRLTALMVPGALIGFLASSRGARWIDGGRLRPAVLGLSSISAVAVLLRTYLMS